MSDETYWLDPDVTEESLRVWAYNPRAHFDFQDEDLLIQHAFRVLLPMADDPSCPKAELILAYVDSYLNGIARSPNATYLTEIEQAIVCCLGATRNQTKEWAALQVRRLRYRAGLGPIGREEGIQLGRDLLIGFRTPHWGTVGDLEVVQESPSELAMVVVFEGKRSRELFVDLATGRYEFRDR